MAGFWDNVSRFLFGSPEKHERVSTLLPEQQGTFNQLQRATAGRGAGGVFGESSDYWRDILSNNPELLQQFIAPEMRQFNEQIIPGLSEQFAGMGAGGLSSSGFRNAATAAGTDLSERLGAIRANLKNSAAQGLFGLGQQALGNYSQDVMTEPGTEGFLTKALGTIPNLAAAYFTGGGNNKGLNSVGAPKVGKNTSPYGDSNMTASPQFQRRQLPSFGGW